MPASAALPVPLKRFSPTSEKRPSAAMAIVPRSWCLNWFGREQRVRPALAPRESSGSQRDWRHARAPLRSAFIRWNSWYAIEPVASPTASRPRRGDLLRRHADGAVARSRPSSHPSVTPSIVRRGRCRNRRTTCANAVESGRALPNAACCRRRRRASSRCRAFWREMPTTGRGRRCCRPAHRTRASPKVKMPPLLVDEPVAVARTRRGDADDRVRRAAAAGGAEEVRVAEGEDAAVARDEPVAVARTGGGDADDRCGEPAVAGGAVGSARRRR